MITLRALIVEDAENDALLLVRQLRQGGFDSDYVRVETAEAMRIQLEQGTWDIVFSDFTMPHFSAFAGHGRWHAAIRALRRH